METRELTTTDVAQVMDLWEAAAPQSGTKRSPELIRAWENSMVIYLEQSTESRLIGAFQEDEIGRGHLRCMVAMDKIHGFPYYSVGFMNVAPSRFFNPAKNGVADVYRFLHERNEPRQWYRYYHHRDARKWKETWKRVWDPEDRYIETIEEFIPANQRPTNEMFWPIMGYQTWTVDTIVKTKTLKPEFRESFRLLDRSLTEC